MMGVKGSYNLLRSSLFKDEVFLDISVWWSSLRYQNHPPSTNVSALQGETLCWQQRPSLGAEPFGQAAQTSSVSVRAGDECGLLRFPTSELCLSRSIPEGESKCRECLWADNWVWALLWFDASRYWNLFFAPLTFTEWSLLHFMRLKQAILYQNYWMGY